MLLLKIALLILSSVVVLSCDILSTHKEIKALMNKEVILPQSAEYYLGGRDTTKSAIENLQSKLVVYLDSTECSTCEITNLYQWSDIVDLNKWTSGKFGVLFVMTPKTSKIGEIRRAIVANSNVEVNILLDTSADMPQKNSLLPTQRRFRTFLLDNNNKVVLVGDPRGNTKLWELYKKEISRLCRD